MHAKRGSPYPFGIVKTFDGINFSLYAPFANILALHLFDNERNPTHVIPLDPEKNRTGNIWHIELDLPIDSFLYGWEPTNSKGLILLKDSFENLALDPFAKSLSSSYIWNDLTAPYAPISQFKSIENFDWNGDRFPKIPAKDLIIYETHVRGFTIDVSSQVKYRGTYLGLIEKIPYLKELGINAIELMPIFEFNEKEYRRINPITQELLCNYWGYSTVHFFTPTNRYAIEDAEREFKELVRACHREGIEVILDVVFNHTAEGGAIGPLYSFKALDPFTYYLISKQLEWENFTGCGNTLNCNNSLTLEWIINCLRHWVSEYHVDGFRFDLASIFYRSEDGNILSNPPILEAISNDPILAHTKLIAEAWDAAGLYQVGSFYPHSKRWAEWNGQWRDTIRRFIKGDSGEKGAFATKISGSEDLFYDRSPQSSINFVTCHDGFTMRDLVSYNRKHNINNGEDDRDGSNDNESWNCGEEGPTTDFEILSIRTRQFKNFIVTLFISQGIPMLFSGDEYGHTKLGNNNTWCQDSTLNWFQWDLLENNELFEFVKGMIHLRKSSPHFRKDKFLRDEDITWYGTTTDKPQWNFENHFVAFVLKDEKSPYAFYIAFNSSNKKVTVTIPKTKHIWQWRVNTSGRPPMDFFPELEGPLLITSTYTLAPYSAIILQEVLKA